MRQEAGDVLCTRDWTVLKALPSKVASLLKLTAWSQQSPRHGLEICRVEDTESDWNENDVFLYGEENVVILVFL